MALTHTETYEAGATRPSPDVTTNMIHPTKSDEPARYWHINTSWSGGTFETRFGNAGMAWYPPSTLLGYSAKGKLAITRDEFSRVLLFDWGQQFHVTADYFNVALIFPRDTQLTSFVVREQFAAAATQSVAGEGGEPIYVSEGQFGLGAGATSAPRVIPWGATSFIFTAGRNNPLSPDPILAEIDVGFFDGINFGPFHTVARDDLVGRDPSPVRLGAEQGVLAFHANSFRVRNTSVQTLNWAIRWSLSPP